MKGKAEQVLLHSPTLDSVLMVEETIRKHGGEFTKFQLWRKLPRGMMYQTYLVILDYLLGSHKIAFDREGKIGWIWNPELVKKVLKQGFVLR